MGLWVAWRSCGVVLALALCSAAQAAPPATDGPRIERGRLLLAQYQCGSCHQIPGVPAARGTLGPSLAGYGRRSYIAGHVPNDVQALARWIVNPAALAPGTAMPSMGVAADQARDMATYLQALR